MIAIKQNAKPSSELEMPESVMSNAKSDVGLEILTLRESITLAKQDIERLTDDLPAVQKTLTDLSTEREKFILPARARGDKSAQQRIEDLNTRIARAKRELQDHENALATANENLENAEISLGRAEREQKRKRILAILDARNKCDLETKLARSLDDLVKLCEELQQRDEETAAATIAFDSNLAADAGQLKSMHAFRGDYAAAKLQKVVPVAFNWNYLAHISKLTLQDRRSGVIERLASRIRRMEGAEEDLLVR